MNAFEEKMWERREGEMIGEKRGRKEGVAQGERTKQRKIARKMVEMKMALDIIAKATGLTEQELNALKNEIKAGIVLIASTSLPERIRDFCRIRSFTAPHATQTPYSIANLIKKWYDLMWSRQDNNKSR